MEKIMTWKQLANALDNLTAIPDDILTDIARRLNKAMDIVYYTDFGGAERNALVKKAYWAVGDEQQRRYSMNNSAELEKYRQKHFAGRAVADIQNNAALMEAWDFYSDYYKDVHGCRPYMADAVR